MNTVRFLALVGMIQGTFLFFAILSRGWKKASNHLLAILALIFAIRLSPASFPGVPFFSTPSQYWSILDSLIFKVGPLMWFYVRNLVGKPVTKDAAKHFIPAFIILLTVFITKEHIRTLIFQVMAIVVYLHIGGYLVAMLSELRRFSRRARNYVSNPEAVELTWFRMLLAGSIVLLLSNVVTDLVSVSSQSHGWFEILELSVAVLFLFGIAYLAIQYPESHHEIREARVQIAGETIDTNDETRYAKNRLGDSVERKILQRLVDHMRESEHFRQDGLRLSDLAGVLGYPEHTISMVLNIHKGENFYQFVNRYRVEAAKAALIDPARSSDSVLKIAYASGFRSKSTFNTVFRDFTGKTPSEFRSG